MLLRKVEIRNHRSLTEDEIVRRIAETIRTVLSEESVGPATVAGIGLGTSGHVDRDRGRLITNSNLPGFTDYPIGERLRAATGMAVHVDNDANAQAYAEYRFGAARGFPNAVFVTISTGIGAGIVIDGRLYRGVTGTAGELGHTIVNPASTLRCGCGNYGCLMAHASGLALPQIVRQKLLRPGVETTIDFTRLADREINGELIGRGFESGDPLCREVVWECADYMGIGLQNAFQVLNPGVIVIGGGLTAWGEAYIDRIRTRFYRTAGAMLSDPIEIRQATLGTDAAVIGAAALVMEST